MSTIDRPEIIAKLLRRNGKDKLEGANFMHSERTYPQGRCNLCGEDHIDLGMKEESKQKRLLMGPRYNAETILEYTTGFGGRAWKLLYGLYLTTSLAGAERGIE